MNIIKDLKNDLLKRREIKLIIKSESNPGYANSLKIISEKFNANADLIVTKGIKSKFGRDSFLIDAFIYNSVKDKERIEPKKKVKEKKQ